MWFSAGGSSVGVIIQFGREAGESHLPLTRC